jgi:hypothetical protein
LAETTDSGLVRRLRARKPAAWDEVYRLYGERVFAFAYELCGNADDASDLVQQTFVRALPRLDKLRPAEVDLADYLLATTQELFQGRRLRSDEDSPEPEPDPQAPPAFAAYELFQRTSDALAWSGYWQRPRRLASTTAVATVSAGLALIGALGAGSAYLVSRSSEPRLFVGATAPVAPSVAVPSAATDAPVAAPKRVKRRARKQATITAATTTFDTSVATTAATPIAPRPAPRPQRRPPKRPPVVVAPPTTATTSTMATTETTQTDTQTTVTEPPPPPPPPTEPPPTTTEPTVP